MRRGRTRPTVVKRPLVTKTWEGREVGEGSCYILQLTNLACRRGERP